LIFLFKYEFEHKDTRSTCNPPNVFFAEQVINNACATQAILSVLLNAQGLDLGTELTEFKVITADCPPEVKGIAIGNSEQIRKVHNSFARPEPFSFSSAKAEKDDDVYHFISYVPVDGVLYELDGLKRGPIDLGPCTEQNWLERVVTALQERIATYTNEIRFVLLALVKNRKQIYSGQIAELRQKKAALEAKQLGGDSMEVDQIGGAERSELQVTTDKIEQILGFIANEESKFANWKAENIRRKHNYIPFLFHLLKTLAEKDLLLPLIERGKQRQKEREEKEKKEKEKEDKSK